MAGVRPRHRPLLFLLLLLSLPSLLPWLPILLLFLSALPRVSGHCVLPVSCLHRTITPKILTLLPSLVDSRNFTQERSIPSTRVRRLKFFYILLLYPCIII